MVGSLMSYSYNSIIAYNTLDVLNEPCSLFVLIKSAARDNQKLFPCAYFAGWDANLSSLRFYSRIPPRYLPRIRSSPERGCAWNFK